MSYLALFVVFLFISMHACNARHNFAFVSHAKDVEDAKLFEKEIKGFPLPITKETSLGGEPATMMATMDESQRERAEPEMKDLKGKARKMIESAAEETKEDTHKVAKEGDEPVEDAMDMDYLQPHHASPIHNLH